MKVTELEVRNFRNIKNAEIEPHSGVNVIFGENAQGKTNLLESIWLFTACRSFRSSKDNELINFNSTKAELSMDFSAWDRVQQAHLEIGEGRKFLLSGIKKSPTQFMGEFLAVVFSPVHLSLIKEGPYERRRFVDTAISQLKPKYAASLAQYNKAIQQRNVLLKDLVYHSELYDTLDVWEDRIAFFASEIIRQRIGYINKLSQYTDEIYRGISSGKEKLSINYNQQTVVWGDSREELYENMKAQLFASRKNDIICGYTSVGPHRDDINVEIDGLIAKSFGSQGQQRSAALAMKLGEAAVVKSFSDEQPVALLDDVMSELDKGRQNYILNHIKDWQVFITCCDPSAVEGLKTGKKFEMKNGKIY